MVWNHFIRLISEGFNMPVVDWTEDCLVCGGRDTVTVEEWMSTLERKLECRRCGHYFEEIQDISYENSRATLLLPEQVTTIGENSSEVSGKLAKLSPKNLLEGFRYDLLSGNYRREGTIQKSSATQGRYEALGGWFSTPSYLRCNILWHTDVPRHDLEQTGNGWTVSLEEHPREKESLTELLWGGPQPVYFYELPAYLRHVVYGAPLWVSPQVAPRHIPLLIAAGDHQTQDMERVIRVLVGSGFKLLDVRQKGYQDALYSLDLDWPSIEGKWPSHEYEIQLKGPERKLLIACGRSQNHWFWRNVYRHNLLQTGMAIPRKYKSDERSMVIPDNASILALVSESDYPLLPHQYFHPVRTIDPGLNLKK
jgi:hypothetical protein